MLSVCFQLPGSEALFSVSKELNQRTKDSGIAELGQGEQFLHVVLQWCSRQNDPPLRWQRVQDLEGGKVSHHRVIHRSTYHLHYSILCLRLEMSKNNNTYRCSLGIQVFEAVPLVTDEQIEGEGLKGLRMTHKHLVGQNQHLLRGDANVILNTTIGPTKENRQPVFAQPLGKLPLPVLKRGELHRSEMIARKLTHSTIQSALVAVVVLLQRAEECNSAENRRFAII